MRYHNSIHFREDPIEEVKSALSNNSVEVVKATLEARQLTEEARTPSDEAEGDRIRQQLAHLAVLTAQVEVVA